MANSRNQEKMLNIWSSMFDNNILSRIPNQDDDICRISMLFEVLQNEFKKFQEKYLMSKYSSHSVAKNYVEKESPQSYIIRDKNEVTPTKNCNASNVTNDNSRKENTKSSRKFAHNKERTPLSSNNSNEIRTKKSSSERQKLKAESTETNKMDTSPTLSSSRLLKLSQKKLNSAKKKHSSNIKKAIPDCSELGKQQDVDSDIIPCSPDSIIIVSSAEYSTKPKEVKNNSPRLDLSDVVLSSPLNVAKPLKIRKRKHKSAQKNVEMDLAETFYIPLENKSVKKNNSTKSILSEGKLSKECNQNERINIKEAVPVEEMNTESQANEQIGITQFLHNIPEDDYDDVDENESLEQTVNEKWEEQISKKSISDFKEKLNSSFDHIDQKKSEPNYAYKNDVVRKKSERVKLEGWDCVYCKKYYDQLDVDPALRKIRMNQCSRHRQKFAPAYNTPRGFWEPMMTPSLDD